jgi:predicted dehydrogenase
VAAPPPIDDRPRLPAKSDYGIAIVGCGGIVNYAHLPAYAAHGLRVLGCYDVNAEAAKETAERHGLGRVYASLGELLADEAVEIVDVAVQPWHQRAIAEAALAAGKHLLLQKPLAVEVADGVAIIEAGRRAGRKVAVNQQMRWTGGIAAARQLIAAGYVGQPTDVQIQVSVTTPWSMWPWLQRSPRLDVLYHSIHYLDTVRSLVGDPEWVTARHARYPGQTEVAETKTLTVLDYPSGLQALIAVNHHNETGGSHAIFRVIGTGGIVEGTIGLLAEYPAGGLDTVRCRQADDPADVWHDIPLTTLWMPDAFIGTMGSLMEAIQSDGVPVTDAADNLTTLRLVHACYRSAAENRSVRLEEVIAS